MREIKFRAWDSEENRMIYTFDGDYTIMVNEEDGTLYCGGHMENGDWNEPILMQYTGLKDDGSKPIFEGDIVSTNTGKLMVIGWSEKFASFVIEREGWLFQHYFGEAVEARECRVLGNIHEDSELLD